jgi:hypothetical protein
MAIVQMHNKPIPIRGQVVNFLCDHYEVIQPAIDSFLHRLSPSQFYSWHWYLQKPYVFPASLFKFEREALLRASVPEPISCSRAVELMKHARWIVRLRLTRTCWQLLPILRKASLKCASLKLPDGQLEEPEWGQSMDQTVRHRNSPGFDAPEMSEIDKLRIARACRLASVEDIPWSRWFLLDLGATLLSQTGHNLEDTSILSLSKDLDELAQEVMEHMENHPNVLGSRMAHFILSMTDVFQRRRIGFDNEDNPDPMEARISNANSVPLLVISGLFPGLPITLSLLYLCVGARLGVPLRGCNMPGHYLLDFEDDNGERMFLDCASHSVLGYEVVLMRYQMAPNEIPPPDHNFHAKMFLRMYNNIVNMPTFWDSEPDFMYSILDAVTVLQDLNKIPGNRQFRGAISQYMLRNFGQEAQ